MSALTRNQLGYRPHPLENAPVGAIKDEIPSKLLENTARLLSNLYPDSQGLQLARAAALHGVRGCVSSDTGTWESSVGADSKNQVHLVRAAHMLRVAALQNRVAERFQVVEIPFLSLKGFSLSKVLYGSFVERDFGDLDLLVPTGRALTAMRDLENLGLVRTYPRFSDASRQEALVKYGKAQTFLDRKTGVTLDLHWKLVSPWIGDSLFEFETLWKRSRLLSKEGLTPWRTLGDEHTTIFLALHGYQDGWNKLKQLLDMAMAMERLEVEWDEVLTLAGVRAPLVQSSAELVYWLLGARLPQPSTRFFHDRRQALSSWLAMATATKTPQSKLLHPSLWDCSAGEWCRRSLRALTTPALDDIESVRLPGPVHSGYVVVRVLRLFWKFVSRALKPHADFREKQRC